MSTAQMNMKCGTLIVETLIRQGVDCFVISPGSRSTPLTVAAARNPLAKTITHFDERGAAFYALGYARGSGRPAALICTSGTAAANYYPAIIEASNDDIPMVVLTADRPPELRNTGANQTIIQPGMYAGYPRFQTELSVPEDSIDLSDFIRTVQQAASTATGTHPGPVHLNCPFREPLIETPDASENESPSDLYDRYAVDLPPLEPPTLPQVEDTVRKVYDLLRNAEECVIVVGRLKSHKEREAVLSLARKARWPVLPDITSGLRMTNCEGLVHHYDLILTSQTAANALRPRMVIHIGGRVVSKRLTEALGRWHPETYLHLADSPSRFDPEGVVTEHVVSDIAALSSSLNTMFGQWVKTNYRARWDSAEEIVANHLRSGLGMDGDFTEPSIVGPIAYSLRPDRALWLASSMPIRDWDMFAPVDHELIDVAANRGASGIDGTIASAVGYAAGLDKPVSLVIGDLALLHDLNSLSLAARSPQPVTIIVLNNNGGRIFEHLPIAKHTDVFEEYFAVPTGVESFSDAAAQFGLDGHTCIPALDPEFNLESALSGAYTSKRSYLIEIQINSPATVQQRRTLRARIAEDLDRRFS